MAHHTNDNIGVDPSLCNVELEQALLGAVLVVNSKLDKISYLNAQHFFEPLHQRLWAQICDLHGLMKPVNAASLRHLFANDPALVEMPDGKNYLAKLSADGFVAADVKSYADDILGLWVKREIVDRCEKAKNAILDSKQPINAVLDELINVGDLGNVNDNVRHHFTYAELLGEALDNTEAAYKNPDEAIGIHTGIEKLDEAIAGLHRQNLVVLAGRPGMGKSTMATTLSHGVVSNNEGEIGAVVFSLEMSAKEWGIRQLAGSVSTREKPIYYDDLRKGKVAGNEDKLFGDIPTGLPLVFDDTGSLSVADIQSACNRYKKKFSNDGIDLAVVVIDQLSHIRPTAQYAGSKVNEIGQIMVDLKGMAKSLDVCVLLLHQLNRGLETRNDKRPVLADLRDSGNIEQDADVALFLYRGFYYDPGEDENHLELIIGKQRMGPLQTVDLWCNVGACLILDDYQATA